MQIVCIREGQMGQHVGDVFDLPDPPEGEEVRFDLTYYSHIDSDASKRALAERAEADGKPPEDDKPEDNPETKPEEPATPVLGDDDAMNEGAN